MGNTRRLEEVSRERHQEKVERYRKIHELHPKKVDQGIIVRLTHLSPVRKGGRPTGIHSDGADGRS